MSVKPIFIFSLPRAGSTLLQRLLCSHEKIDTQAEPWLALPLFFALKKDGVNSIYGHNVLSNAINGYVNSLPGGRDDYYKCASNFLNELYACGSSENACYFIDKTPRYHLIVNEILLAFPDAKIIFLWRNPLSIAASMIKTWGRDKWNLYMFHVDLYSGIDSLASACDGRKDILSVNYESLVQSPENEMKRIMSYLELDYKPDIIESFRHAKTIDAPGRGDPIGQYKYKGISSKSTSSWKGVMTNPFRKYWGKKYLAFVGEERLKVMGYNLNEIQQELNDIPTDFRYLFSDIIRNVYGMFYNRFCIEAIRSNKPWGKYIYFPKS